MRTHIARAHDRDYTGRVDSLLERGTVDGVLIHVRVMVMKRARLLIGRERRRLGYSFHPALFSRTHRGAAIEELRRTSCGFRASGAPVSRAWVQSHTHAGGAPVSVACARAT